MSILEVPVISVIIGEGGSGGALGIGIANRVLMLENAYYSVITPEGCAAILFHDSGKAREAAEALRITADDLMQLGVVDEILPEPLGGAHRDAAFTAGKMKEALLRNLEILQAMATAKVVEDRYNKFRKIGVYQDSERKKIKAKKI